MPANRNCKWRHLVENYFAKIKEFRGIATRHDKTDCSYAAYWNLVAALIEVSRRLQTIPGVAPLTAMSIEAFAPSMGIFRYGRDFAAWLGLVPKQHSSGGKARLGKVSKEGQVDIRRLLIIGAMSRIHAQHPAAVSAQGEIGRRSAAVALPQGVSKGDFTEVLRALLGPNAKGLRAASTIAKETATAPLANSAASIPFLPLSSRWVERARSRRVPEAALSGSRIAAALPKPMASPIYNPTACIRECARWYVFFGPPPHISSRMRSVF